MYNRYIPQPDGSYRRNQITESRRQETPQKNHEPEEAQVCPPVNHPCPNEPPEPERSPHNCRQESSIGAFFRQLLPKDLDTGDLLIIILLLLMAADCREEQNTAMLTLALYLFL